MESTPQNLSHRCSKCMDTGMLCDTVYYTFCNLYGQRYCSCPAGEKAFRQWCLSEPVQQALKKRKTKEIQSAFQFSNLPKRWHEKTLDNLVGQEKVKLTINQYLDNFPRFQKSGKGIYLWSNGSGRGKTHLLTAIFQELTKRYAVSSIFMTEEQIFMKIRESFYDPHIHEKGRLAKFFEIPCLFIDDLGATKVTAWKTEVLTSIVDYRMSHLLPTFFTSNYNLEDYQQLIDNSASLARPERIPSRIYEMCQGFIIEMKGEDWRRKIVLHP